MSERQDGLTEADLSVARDDDLAVFANGEDCRPVPGLGLAHGCVRNS